MVLHLLTQPRHPDLTTFTLGIPKGSVAVREELRLSIIRRRSRLSERLRRTIPQRMSRLLLVFTMVLERRS